MSTGTVTNSASGGRGATLQTLLVGVGGSITNSASGGRGQHYKLC